MAAITLSGFNNIDFKSIIDLIIKSERTPIDRLTAQQSSEQTRLTAFGSLSTTLSTLESASTALKAASTYGNRKAASSDESILTASATSSASKGTFTIDVSSLARPQMTASAARQFSDINATIVDAGAFSITQSGITTNIDLTGVNTLSQLRDAINSQQTGVKAAIINDGSTVDDPPKPFRLALTSVEAGTSNAFTVDDQTTFGGSAPGAVLNLSTDPTNGVAQNTVFQYSGITVQSTSTTVTDSVPGVTLNLLHTGTATVTVADDDSGLKDNITAFVAAFNKFGDFVQTQITPGATAATRPPLATDTLLRGANRQLRAYLTADHANGGSIQNLSELGITLDRTGKLQIDDAALEQALAENRAGVEQFFSGATGFASKVSTFLDSYTDTGGAIETVETRIKKTIDGYGSRILDLESRLALREEVLTNQFAAADRAISQLNSQANALNGLGNQFRLF